MRIVIRAAAQVGMQGQPIDWLSIASNDALPNSLREAAARASPGMPRLASRFAQLAVIGARRCLAALSEPLPELTPLIVCTGLGDVAATDALYYEVMPPSSQMASPARFATSGNNMASFFVARLAGLSGRNFTLSHEALSFEQGLWFAVTQLTAARVGSVLLGCVDETTQPREFYARRFAPALHRVIGEGSAWFVLDVAGDVQPPSADLAEVLLVRILPSSAPDPQQWARDVIAQVTAAGLPVEISATGDDPLPAGVGLLAGCRVSAEEIAALLRHWPAAVCYDTLSASACFPTAVGVALGGLVNGDWPATRSGHPVDWLHVNRDASGRTGIIAIRVPRADS